MKKQSVIRECSFQEAHRAITTALQPLEQEPILLFQSLGRINGRTICAERPKPFYDQSTRDGFALAEQPSAFDASWAEFQVRGELAAGCTEQQQVVAGEAYRIMTGALPPGGTARVVPFEICREEGTKLFVPQEALLEKELHIRSQGQDVKQGQVLISAGARLCPEHLLLLAEEGVEQVAVYRRPRVAVVCTGSELIKNGENPLPGQKVSSNGMLLASLLQAEQCQVAGTETVGDDADKIIARIQEVINQEQPDLVITTGGMGPGKFDLLEQVVSRLGGKPIYNRLQIRPGKSTLFAIIGSTPLFALPGPPPAVRLLFHELIVPGLHRLQGLPSRDEPASDLVDAVVKGPVRFRRSGHLVLKSAVASVGNGQVQVRPTKRLEPMNAIMHLAGPKEEKEHWEIAKGQQVQVRLLGSLATVNEIDEINE
ncbi:MAG: molybdopterin molybdotransferase MoeA [Candidatus Electrothrix scaldis]|nr:MAG: molybdopterin molybdotransferase MoeA [Candidatus Electrothrix sp. GW3-3]